MSYKAILSGMSTLVVLTGILVSGNAVSHPDHEGEYANHKERMRDHNGRGKDILHRVFSKLDLTDEQKSSIKSLKESNKESMKSIHLSMRSAKKQMKELLAVDEPDETAVKTLSAEMSELKAEKMLLQAKFKREALAMLTDEQREKLEKMKEKRRKHRASRNEEH